jgi:[ribosomal protein S18]-alanine N-acetyltransferase
VNLMLNPRTATSEEVPALWPAVRADRLFDSPEVFLAYRDNAPWRVRISGRGEASILGVWRAHLDILAMRGVWCSPRHVGLFVDDARRVARELGLGNVISPLLPLEMIGIYLRAGMEVCERIVAMQALTQGVLAEVGPPSGVTLRAGAASDLPALAELDAECFDRFWRYGPHELWEYLTTERLIVAETVSGAVIGYTLATASRGAATLGRLAVAPPARRHGVARALVADVASWALNAGAVTLSLCTQEGNIAARRLYAGVGLNEIPEVYGLAMSAVDEGGGGA